GRVGGMAQKPSPNFKAMTSAVLPRVMAILGESEALLLQNRIFIDRLQGIGKISSADAIALGWTGPCLRSTGVAYDVRKAHPYLVYDRLAFDVPVGQEGDNWDRFMVRLEEMRQSVRIIEQAIEQM